VDDEVQEQVSWQLETDVMRQATLPRILLLKD
jgi:Ser-tRNA(Ala) deacylase AlaX